MRNARKLSLKREALTPLSTDEMTAVAGGSHACVTENCTDPVTHGPSFDAQCPTFPVNYCIQLSRAICDR